MQMSASFGGILTLYVYNHCFQTWDQVCLINGLIATTGHLVVVSEDDCIQRLCLLVRVNISCSPWDQVLLGGF